MVNVSMIKLYKSLKEFKTLNKNIFLSGYAVVLDTRMCYTQEIHLNGVMTEYNTGLYFKYD